MGRRLLAWQRHSEAGAAAKAEAVVARSRPRTPGCGRSGQRTGFAGPPIQSNHDRILRRHGTYPGSLRPRCRLVRRSGHLIAAGTRAAPTRPEHQRRGRRGRWLLRPASDSQMGLQAAADRAASEHFGDSCSRDKAGLSADPAEDSTAGRPEVALVANRRSAPISARRPVAQSKRGYGSFRPRAAARTRGEWKAGLSARRPSRQTGLRRAELRKWRIAGRAAHPGRRPAIVLARAWSLSGFHDRVCPGRSSLRDRVVAGRRCSFCVGAAQRWHVAEGAEAESLYIGGASA